MAISAERTLEDVNGFIDTGIKDIESVMHDVEMDMVKAIASGDATGGGDVGTEKTFIESVVASAGLYGVLSVMLNSEYQRVLNASFDQYSDSLDVFPDGILERLGGLKTLDYTSMIKQADDLVDEITRAMVNFKFGSMSQDDLLAIVSKASSKVTGRLTTLFDTGMAGYYQEASNLMALEAGLNRAKYLGPLDSKTRPFCSGVLNGKKTYTRKEIIAMDNGQGLPVLQYRGGWKCRHVWEWIK